MIPIKLTIEGLYSYQKRQTIDFENLINAGLFGIFGAVGSGKSSLLEAITFALYGETERLNKQDKRSYNMMNLKSDTAFIAFDFYNYENKIFRVTREFKRNSKRFDDIKSPTVVFYEWINDHWIPLNHSNAQEIVGLSYDNFKRTIIIPQGKFKEFIELGAKDRTQMMKEIFKLHRFDLQDKVSLLNSRNLTDLNQLEGKLSGYDEVSEEHITALNEKWLAENALQTQKQNVFKTINDKLQHLKNIKTDFESLQNKRKLFAELKVQKPKIDQKKTALELYQRIYTAFHQLLIDRNKTEQEAKEKSDRLENGKNLLKNSEAELLQLETAISKIKPYINDLPNKRLEETDLDFIAKILQFTQEVNQLQNRTKNGEAKVAEMEQVVNQLKETIKQTENDITLLAKNQIETGVLINVGDWFSKKHQLEKERLLQQEKKQFLKSEMQQIETELHNEKIVVATFEEDIKHLNENLLQQKKTLQAKLQSFQVQHELAQFAHNLHNGEACPLCGSLEHPEILTLNDVTFQINEIQKEIDTLEEKQNNAVEFANKAQQKIQKLAMIQEQFSRENQQLEALQLQMDQHHAAFDWEDFNADNYEDFQQKKQASLSVSKQIDSKNKFIADQRLNLESQLQTAQKYRTKLEEFKLEETAKKAHINQNLSNLKVLVFTDFERCSVEEIEQKLNDLKTFNQKIENDFNAYNKQFNECHTQIQVQKAANISLEKDAIALHKKLENLNDLFKKQLVEQQIESEEKVVKILDLNWNVEAVRAEIEAFTVAYKTLNNQIQELETKLKDEVFNANDYLQLEKAFETAEIELKTATENVTKTKAEINRLTKAFIEKKELLSALDQLKKRAENLKTMTNLFKAAGFVQYVSSIYLKQLCENANVRFRIMTRNQLSLQVNESNDFEVIDYLNEGRTRSVKTLSGGQMFQVSLSLALALAESVQTNSVASKNFFFIDEGFGTQDAESVNIVFETLNNLHKEHRIVGIISHVEELKERIPIALQITKSAENGSEIAVL
ncbi:SbcC/MukB-like Walker B domain-containing protein [Paenimyroides aestuarii]|uniref:SMC family ATPase n=1 Tax=Paenimyroides aestuarii TaxID=2968490 RepID=A0ABY5NV36_9FLAO|nr:SMC family ATPase [Paenimyroides aestuarii]UUV22447.1 SMC family ATPase [Paenimyroides aestuarii]